MHKLKRASVPVVILVVVSLLIAATSVFFVGFASGYGAASNQSQSLPATPIPALFNESYASTSGTSMMPFGEEKDDWGYDLKHTSDGGTVTAGYTTSFGVNGSDMYLVRTALATYYLGNITGTYQKEDWEHTYGGLKDEVAFGVTETSDQGYALAGYTNSFGAGRYDIWLVKTYANGTMQWNMTYGGPQNDAAYDIVQTSDGGFLLVGYTTAPQTQTAWLGKTDALGNMQWNKTLPGEAINAIIQTKDGDYALAIEYPNAFGFATIDVSGQIGLNQTYNGPCDRASAQSLVQADDGGYAIAGYFTNHNTGANSSWLIKTDQFGNQQWSRTYGNYAVYGIAKTLEGGYAMTGDRACLIVTNLSGNLEYSGLQDSQLNDSIRFTRTYAVFELRPNRFVMAGIQDNPYIPGCSAGPQAIWVQVDLKPSTLSIPSSVAIMSPQNITYTQRDVPLTFYVNDTTRFLMCSAGSINYNFSIPGNTTLSNLPNGQYAVRVYATDMNYNTGFSQSVSFTVDSGEPYEPPQVTIWSPTDSVYNLNQVSLNFTVSQQTFWAAYSLDGGENMTAFPNANLVLIPLANGIHTVTVFAGDIPNGKVGYATTNFTIVLPYLSAPYPSNPIWPIPTLPVNIGNQIMNPSLPSEILVPLVSTASSSPELVIIAAIIVAVIVAVALFSLRIKPKPALST